MKATMHKGCSCPACKRGKGTKNGQSVKRANEHKLRRSSKRALDEVLKGADDAVIAPISSPYTD